MNPPAAIHQHRFFPDAAPAASASAASASAAFSHAASASAMQDAPASSLSGPRALQVVWQGQWGADEGAPTPMDVDGASSSSSVVSAAPASSSVVSTAPASSSVVSAAPASASADPRMQSRQKELRASSLRELKQSIHANFPTSDDRPLQLTDEQQSPIDSESAFQSLSPGAVVLVFDSADRSTRFTWSSSFQHIPHPSVVTFSQELIGMATRSSSKVFAHALAEFIDNSISALRKQQSRGRSIQQGEICVSFLESRALGSKKQFTVVVSDNGCGMDQSMVQTFCRMGDAPQYRNEAREDTKADENNNFINVNISQWGVGAKSAGFYIGDCIVVTSRQPALDQVLQCTLSQKKMFRDHQTSGNAFSDSLVHRPVADVNEAAKGLPPQHPYLRHLITLERSAPHFTRISVTGLEERHLEELAQPDVIARELANIYSRFLHGPMGRNCGDANAGKVWLSPTITVEHIAEEPASAQRWKLVYRENLKHLNDNETSIYQLRHRGPVLRFRMEVDAPSANSHSSEMSVGGKAVINGELYYLPRGVDGESHPVLRAKADEKRELSEAGELPLPAGKTRKSVGGKTAASLVPSRHAVVAGSAGASTAATAAAATPMLGSADKVDAEGNLVEESPTPIFDLYWHGRLIPFASINLLPFMKFTPETRDCKPRLHGALFFSFPFLTSRNKLTMAERDLEGYLSQKLSKDFSCITPLDDRGLVSTVVLSRQHNIEKAWLKCRSAWKALDANYEWKEENFLAAESQAQGKRLYKKVSFAGEAIDELVVGKIYKLRDPDAKAPTTLWLKAVWFEQETSTGPGGGKVLEPKDKSFGSLGMILGTLMPKGAHTDALVRRPLRHVDKTTPMDEQREEYVSHCALEMSKQPQHMEVWLEPRTMLQAGTTSFRKAAGWAFPACAVAAYGYPLNGVAKPLPGQVKERVECVISKTDDEEWMAPEEVAAKTTATTGKPQTRMVNGKSMRNAKKSEKGAAAAAAASARPAKKARHASSSAAAAAADTESDEERSDSTSSDTDQVLMRQDAECMAREVALAVNNGARVEAGGGDKNEASATVVAAGAAAASSALSGKKRKPAAAASSKSALGRQGFVQFDFGKKCGHYRIKFTLLDWILDKHLMKRDHVAPVYADVVLLPAIPSRIVLTSHPATLDMKLGVQLEDSATPQLIALRLIDQYQNEWNRTTLRGETARCGVRIASMNATAIESIDESVVPAPAGPAPALLTTFDPHLAYDQKLHRWCVRGFSITLPQDKHLTFANAASRIEVRVSMKFDVEAQYAFDPALTAAELAQLRGLECSFTVRLGPGKPESFVYHSSFGDFKTLVNGDTLSDLSLNVEDGWGHRTTDSNGMQMCLSSSCTELIPHQPFQSFNAAGELTFDPMRIQIPPELFQRHCTWSETDGQMTVQVQLGVEYVSSHEDAALATAALKAAAAPPSESKSDAEAIDAEVPENPMTNVKQLTLHIRSRWGPVRMMLMPDDSHLSRPAEEKAPPELLNAQNKGITLEGEAGQAMPSLHIAFLQESGQFLSVEAIRDALGARRSRQLHFYVNSLVEAEDAAADSATRSATSFTLADLDPSGRLSGLALPQVLLASHAEPEPVPRTDGSMLCRAEIVMKIIEGTKMEDDETDDDPDVMVDEARSSKTLHAKAELRAKIETAPKLSALMPAATLSAPFFLRLRPCAPVRWQMSQNFPRGFKCGVVWQDFVRIGIVDRFGNACSIPEGVSDNDMHVDFIDGLQQQANAIAAAGAGASADSATSMDLDGASTSAAAGSSSSLVPAPAVASASAASASSTGQAIRSLRFSRPLLADNTPAPYFIAKDAFIVAKAGTHTLVARDLANRFTASDSLTIHLIAGLAFSIRAFRNIECTESLGYSSMAPSAVRDAANSIRVSSKGKVARTFVRFYDRGDNETLQPANTAIELRLNTGHPDNKPKPEEIAAQAAAAVPMEVEGAAVPASTPAAAAAPAGADAATTVVPAASASSVTAASSLDSSDATVSGVYPYPITCDTLQSGRAAPAIGTKGEYTPLSHLTGAQKFFTPTDATISSQCSLIEEFTLHLHRAHWATSSLVIRSRELSAKKSTIRNEIIIPLDVKPFLSAVETVALHAEYDASAMEAALQAKPDALTLQAALLKPPSSAAATLPQSAAAAAVVSATLPAVPAGTPFPSIFVDLLMDGSEVAGMSASTTAPAAAADVCSAAAAAASSDPAVKVESELEADSTGSLRSSVWLAGFLLPGLSIDVVWSDGQRNEKQGFVYKKPTWDATLRRFVFAPTGLSDVVASSASASSFHPEDYCLHHAGEWLFLVRYLEPRPEVQAVLLPSDCERVAKITQPVTHGQPHKLRIAVDSLDTNIVVCNGEAAAAQTRCVAPKLALELVDAFDQPVQLSALSEESLQGLRSLQWKIEPAPKAPAAPPAASAGARNSSASASMVIDLLDSDNEEDTNMRDAAAVPAASSASAAAATAAASPAVPALVPPQLILAAPVLDVVRSRVEFPSAITIVPNCAGDSGRYSLSFFLPPPFSSPLLRASLNFLFTNSVREMMLHQEAARVKNAQLKEAKDQYASKMTAIAQAQQTAKQLEDEHARIAEQQRKQIEQMQRLCSELRQHDLDPPMPSASAPFLVHCADWLARKRTELQQLAGSHSGRTADSLPVRLPSIRTLATSPASRLTKAQGFHGCLVELAYVEDLKVSVLVSWHMQGNLSCFITSDRASVADRELRSWCRENKAGAVIDLKLVNKKKLSPLLPHVNIKYDAGATNAAVAAARAAGLPLPAPVPFDPRTVRGNPRLLLSQFRFNSDHPAERDQYASLFVSLIGNTIILDNMEDAAAYRQLLLNNGQNCPNLLALRELKQLSANNIERFDPGATAGGLDRMNAYFQVKPAATNPHQRAQEQLAAVDAAAQRVHEWRAEYDECARAITGLNYDQRSSAHKHALASLFAQLDSIRNEVTRLGGTVERSLITAPSASAAAAAHQSGGVNARRAANARSIDAAAAASSSASAARPDTRSHRGQFFPAAPAAAAASSSSSSSRGPAPYR